jgi:tetratricopeptide (TPR) repeat protein
MRKQPVICTADDYGGDCVNLLITLNPQEDSLKILNQLKEALLGKQKGPVIHTSDTPQIYYEIDLEQAIKNAPVEQISQTVISQASSEVNNTPKYTGIVKQVDDIAEKITIRIDVANGENGSGVIIGKQGKTYYVATACHVVSLPRSGRNCTTEKLLDSFTLTTPDGENHTLTSVANKIIILNPDFDVAVIKFSSDKTYQVAELGDYQVEDKKWLFVSGFPGQDSNKQRLLTAGRVRDKELSAFLAKDHVSLTNGNELLYSNPSFRGMSGGAVLDAQGRVIGINTASEDEFLEINDNNSKEISLGYSLGIPTITFLGLTSQRKVPVESLKIISTATKEINDAESQQIEDQLFIFEQPLKDSNALDWLNYGNQLWRASRLEESFAAFDQAIQRLEKEGKKKTLAKAYYAKGLALSDGSKYQEALEAFTQATVADSTFYQAWRYQGLIFEFLQKYEQALTAYQKAIDNNRDKNDFTLYAEQGGILKNLTRYPEALNSFNQAIKLKPNHPWNYNNRGLVYADLKEWDLALDDLKKAIMENPKNAQFYYNRAIVNKNRVYQNLTIWDVVIADLNKAIELNPKYTVAYWNRGNVYTQMQYFDLAETDYNTAIIINDKETGAYYNRGYLYSIKGRLDLAFSDYSKTIELDKNFALAYGNRGVIYKNLKRWDLAEDDYTKAIELNQNNQEAAVDYYNRGYLYQLQKKWQLALDDYKMAIKLFSNKLDPNLFLVYKNRGLVYSVIQKWDLAYSDFNQAVILASNNSNKTLLAESFLYQEILANSSGNKENTIKGFQQAAQLFQEQGDTERYEIIMEILRQLGR